MKTLTPERFHRWLADYGRASRENDPQASASLFSENARYYENPFDDPITGRDAIRKYWEGGAQRLKDKESTFEILSVRDNLGMARWWSKFTVIESGKRLALDCIFLVEFGENNECTEFREWWHLQTVDA